MPIAKYNNLFIKQFNAYGIGSPITTPYKSEAFIFSSQEDFLLKSKTYRNYIFQVMRQRLPDNIAKSKFTKNSFTWYTEERTHKIDLL